MPTSNWEMCWPDPTAPDGESCHQIFAILDDDPHIIEPDPTTVSPDLSPEFWQDLSVLIGVEQATAHMTDDKLRARLASVAEELVVELGKRLPSEVVLKRIG